MQRHAVTSTSIVSIGYDAQQRALEIEFRTGAVYRYREVPPEVYAWLMRVPSKGAFVSRQIVDRFAFERVDPASAATVDLADALRRSLSERPDRD